MVHIRHSDKTTVVIHMVRSHNGPHSEQLALTWSLQSLNDASL